MDSQNQSVYAYDATKDLKIDGCKYKIEIWLNCMEKSSQKLKKLPLWTIKETKIGTSSYAAKVNLNKLIPHILPMHGLKVKYTCLQQSQEAMYEYHAA